MNNKNKEQTFLSLPGAKIDVKSAEEFVGKKVTLITDTRVYVVSQYLYTQSLFRFDVIRDH